MNLGEALTMQQSRGVYMVPRSVWYTAAAPYLENT